MHRFAIGCGCLMLLVACSSTKEICDDGIDNNCDFLTDAEDPKCAADDDDDDSSELENTG